MTAQILPEPLKDGTYVRIIDSGWGRAQIVEDRGLLGPNGTRVYRVLVARKPRTYIQVMEHQLALWDDPASPPPTVPVISPPTAAPPAAAAQR